MDTYRADFSHWLLLLLSPALGSQVLSGSTQSQHVEREGTTLPFLDTLYLYLGHYEGRERMGDGGL